MKVNIRLLYLYLFSFVGLFIIIIGSITIVNLGIKTFIFPEADIYTSYPVDYGPEGKASEIDPEKLKEQQKQDQSRQKQRELSNAVAMLIVGAPVYLYHWKTIQKEAKS